MDLQEAIGPDLQILRELGKGAMATVYLAKEPELGRLVAVKVLLPGPASHEESRLRFEREARSAAALVHPHVVAVHRAGRLPDDTPYMVMQFVKGRTMAERLKAEGQLPLDQACQVLHDVASALAAAHAQGIVHRDLRPENVLWDEDRGIALLTDFGIAGILVSAGRDVTPLTRTGQLVGNPRYLSPEQLRDEELTARADVYSLGVLGYELLTGDGPYEARSNTEWITAHLTKDPKDLQQMRPGVKPETADLLRRCLAREPNHRPSAADVVQVLEGGRAQPMAAAAGSAADPLQELVRRRIPGIVLSAVVAGAALIGLADAVEDMFGPLTKPLTLVFVAAGVLASTVVAWFHGEKGRQRAPALEYLLLGVIAIGWIAGSVWVVLGG